MAKRRKKKGSQRPPHRPNNQAPQKKTWRFRPFDILWIIGAILVLIFIFWFRPEGNQSPDEPTFEEKQAILKKYGYLFETKAERTQFLDQLLVSAPGEVSVPPLEPLPPVSGADLEFGLWLRLTTLVKNFPVAQMAKDFQEETIIPLVGRPPTLAMFVILPWARVPAQPFTGLRFDPAKPAQVMLVSEHRLEQFLRKEEKRRDGQAIKSLWAILFHEWVHFLQMTTVEHLKEIKAVKKGRLDRCQHFWRAEHEAYSWECRLVMKWDFPFLNGFCDQVDTPAFDRAVFNQLKGDGNPISGGCSFEKFVR